MLRQTRAAVYALAILVLFMSVTPAMHAQAPRISIGLMGEITHPILSARAQSFWNNAGRFRTGLGTDLDVAVDGQRFGAALGLHMGRTAIGTRDGRALGLAAAVRWRPADAIAQWVPRISVGYVRLGLGYAHVYQRELRTEYLDRNGLGGNPAIPEETTMYGNGLRLGISAEHRLAPWLGLEVLAGTDLMWFGTVDYANTEFTLHASGLSLYPRIGLGVRLRNP